MKAAQATAGIPTIQLHHRLAIAMEYADVKRSEMADVLGVSGNTVSNYTNGNTRPSTAVMRVWALRCGVPFAWIEHGIEGETDPNGAPTSTKWCRDIRPLHAGTLQHLALVAA